MSQVSERQARDLGVDPDALAPALNQVARALNLTAPLVTSTGTAPNRTFTVDDEVQRFVQGRARRGAAQRPATPQVDNHGWE